MVRECAVVGVPHPVYGETAKAFVVAAKDGWEGEEELRTFLSGKLSDYKVPRLFSFCKSLPKSPSGKIIKRILSRQ
jgi:acyl-coenzyme A synthetase/AMP-(fatty) acid ligase